MAPSEPAPADWSALPSPVLDLVSRRISAAADYVRFRAVCTSWRSATPPSPPHLPCNQQIPWLVLPFPEASDVCHFFSLPDGKTHSMELPWARGNHLCGSSFGWLAFLDTSINMFLLNPLTRQRIPLPPLRGTTIPSFAENGATDTGGDYIIRDPSRREYACDFDFIRRNFLNRFALSSDPTSADCVAMAVFGYGEKFAFCRLGGGGSLWTVLASPVSDIGDIIFHEGRFHAVDAHMVMYVCDVGPPARIREFPCPSGEEDLPDYYVPLPMERCLVQGRRRRGEIVERVYLVESRAGDLLMVLRTYDDVFAPPFDGDLGHLMLDFEVYMLNRSGERPRWVELESLGDQALFLGPAGTSLSVSAGDFPPGVCRGNCIYFGDYWPERHKAVVHGGPDFGVFHYGDGHVERKQCFPVEADAIWKPSFWVTPSLGGHYLPPGV